MKRTEYPLNLFNLASMTGSRAICRPAPTTTDEDWVVFGHNPATLEQLAEAGWVCESRDDPRYGNNFLSYRKDDLNIIICLSKKYYEKYAEATKLAKLMNLMQREQRVILFKYVRGEDWDE